MRGAGFKNVSFLYQGIFLMLQLQFQIHLDIKRCINFQEALSVCDRHEWQVEYDLLCHVVKED